MAPIVRGRKGEYVKELDDARRSGFVRVRVDGSIYDLCEEIKMEKTRSIILRLLWIVLLFPKVSKPFNRQY